MNKPRKMDNMTNEPYACYACRVIRIIEPKRREPEPRPKCRVCEGTGISPNAGRNLGLRLLQGHGHRPIEEEWK